MTKLIRSLNLRPLPLDLIKTYVDLRSVKGYTALHFAVVEENMALVRLLTEEYRADVNVREQVPLSLSLSLTHSLTHDHDYVTLFG